MRASEVVITLDQALGMALRKSPVLDASRREVDAAGARLTQANAAYFPQVSLTAGYGHIWTDSAQNTFAVGNTSSDDYSAGLSVSQYIFDFGKTSGLVEKNRQSLEATGKNLQATEKTLIRDVKQSYFEILKMQQLVTVSQENLELIRRQLAQATALYKSGMRPRIDLTQAQVQLSQAELRLLNDRYSLRQSILAMERVLGGPPADGPYSLAEESPAIRHLPDLDSLINLAGQSRPEIAGIEAQIKSAEAGLVSAKRSAFPSLSAVGYYTNSGVDQPFEEDRWQVGANLSWPIFTGLRRSGQVDESNAEVYRLKAQWNNLKLTVTEEVTRAYLRVEATGEAVKTSEVALQQARENLLIAEGRYKTGVSHSLELTSAQVLYTGSRSSLVQAEYEQYKALADLEFAVGGVYER